MAKLVDGNCLVLGGLSPCTNIGSSMYRPSQILHTSIRKPICSSLAKLARFISGFSLHERIMNLFNPKYLPSDNTTTLYTKQHSTSGLVFIMPQETEYQYIFLGCLGVWVFISLLHTSKSPMVELILDTRLDTQAWCVFLSRFQLD